MRAGWVESRTVLAYALSFFVRHYPVVFAFGALASAQRFLAVGGGEQWAWTGGVGGEVFTNGVRVLFLVWVVRRMLPGIPAADVGRGLQRYLTDHASSMVVNGAVLVALTLVFKLGIDTWVASLAEPRTALAWVLAVKNVTIIPFMMVWFPAILRAAVSAAAPGAPGRSPAAARAARSR
jgi:hypothetical protein